MLLLLFSTFFIQNLVKYLLNYLQNHEVLIFAQLAQFSTHYAFEMISNDNKHKSTSMIKSKLKRFLVVIKAPWKCVYVFAHTTLIKTLAPSMPPPVMIPLWRVFSYGRDLKRKWVAPGTPLLTRAESPILWMNPLSNVVV